jgi:hypothetical protein
MADGRSSADDQLVLAHWGERVHGFPDLPIARQRLIAQELPEIVRAKLGKFRRLRHRPTMPRPSPAQRLDDFIAKRPMPVFPWLYVLTRDQLGKANKKHRSTVSVCLADESAGRIRPSALR